MVSEAAYVSTGALPASGVVEGVVHEAYEHYRGVTDGEVSSVYPALARVPAASFGLCVVGVDGATHAAGDADTEFAVMSAAKPFVFALVAADRGVDDVRDEIGVDATGLPFDSLAAIERTPGGQTNPMVNAGAIATTSRVPGASTGDRWAFVRDGLSRFAGRELALDEETYASASASNRRNRAIVQLLDSVGRLEGDPAAALDLYTRQSSLRVTARDLAVMGATLADGGVNPVTGQPVVDAETCRCTLVVMAIAGMYESSGRWLYDVGLPAKSGIGGGIVTVAPGKGGVGTFAPPLDAAGNSVRGQLATTFLSRRLGLDLFASAPP
jgi:glutaminase